MDGIEGLDDGVNSHFTFQAGEFPILLRAMEPAYYISGYVGTFAILVLIVVLFALQRNWRSALIAILSFVSAICVIHLAQTWVPRARPQDAIRWLGEDAKTGSYPAAGVFLFMLDMMLLGRAVWKILPTARRSAFTMVATLLTVWVCMCQFILALHYLTDVIGALAGAALIGWLAIRLMDGPSPPAVNAVPASVEP